MAAGEPESEFVLTSCYVTAAVLRWRLTGGKAWVRVGNGNSTSAEIFAQHKLLQMCFQLPGYDESLDSDVRQNDENLDECGCEHVLTAIDGLVVQSFFRRYEPPPMRWTSSDWNSTSPTRTSARSGACPVSPDLLGACL